MAKRKSQLEPEYKYMMCEIVLGLAFKKAGLLLGSLEILSLSSEISIQVVDQYYLVFWVDPTDCDLTGGHFWIAVVHSETGDEANFQDRRRAVAIWRAIGRLFDEMTYKFFRKGDQIFSTSTTDSRDRLYRRVGFTDTEWTREESVPEGVNPDRPILRFQAGIYDMKL